MSENTDGLKVYDFYERMVGKMTKALNPVQNELADEFVYKKVYTEGKDVENMAKTFHTEKLKHISLSKLVVHGVVQSHNFSIFPDGKYDLPFFGTDVVIFGKMIVMFCDIQPYLRDRKTDEKYISPIKLLHEKYKNLPNEIPRDRGWLKNIASGYGLNVTSTNLDCLEESFAATMDYFETYVSFVSAANPLDDDERIQKVAEGRKRIVQAYIDQDPGYGPMKKYFGREGADYYFHNILFAGG